ncbi:ankyrin repeat domain-containing protein 66 [Delphinus delphis]|uniref:ankyrin repeat domain-containing protein 66 n=1 Tax=Delphinus delphis TaxID=9728 RepID=UPI0028C491B5|nr:ankyrin repeat domain-containing protein 66 [Delphinus delphis]
MELTKLSDMTKLHQAVAAGDYNSVKKILKKSFCGPDYKEVDWNDRTPLHWAAIKEHRLRTRRLSGHGPRAHPLRGTWYLPAPGHEPAYPASVGGLSTTAPPGKPRLSSTGRRRCPGRMQRAEETPLCRPGRLSSPRALGVESWFPSPRAEPQCRDHRQATKQKGLQLDQRDEDWDAKKRELELSLPSSKQNTNKKKNKTRGPTRLSNTKDRRV